MTKHDEPEAILKKIEELERDICDGIKGLKNV